MYFREISNVTRDHLFVQNHSARDYEPIEATTCYLTSMLHLKDYLLSCIFSYYIDLHQHNGVKSDDPYGIFIIAENI